jgi:hypothetical protein
MTTSNGRDPPLHLQQQHLTGTATGRQLNMHKARSNTNTAYTVLELAPFSFMKLTQKTERCTGMNVTMMKSYTVVGQLTHSGANRPIAYCPARRFSGMEQYGILAVLTHTSCTGTVVPY